MTNKTDLIREIHEYVTAHGGENTATHLLVQAASAIQTQAAELEAVGAGGVQALSAGPGASRAAPPSTYVNGAGIHAEDGASAVIRKLDARFHDIVTFKAVDAATASPTPTPPALSAAPAGFVPVAAFDRLHAHAESLAARLLAAEQAAPKAAPGEPGWWRKRADEIEVQVALTGSPEAMRCYTDMRTLLQAAAGAAPQQEASQDTMYLLRRLLSNQHTLTGPEFRAELEKIVGEAYQQEAQEPDHSLRTDALCQLAYCNGMKAGWNYCVDGNEVDFARAMEGVSEAIKVLRELRENAPQPAPAPLSQREEIAMIDAVMVEMANIVPPLKRSECASLIRAALAAQGGA